MSGIRAGGWVPLNKLKVPVCSREASDCGVTSNVFNWGFASETVWDLIERGRINKLLADCRLDELAF